MEKPEQKSGAAPESASPLERHHLRVGFLGLLVFVLGGTLLETLHGFKVPLYLDVGNETRRLMWRLAHAHGGILSIVNVVYAVALARAPQIGSAWTSRLLVASLVLLPFGFFAGGIVVHGGDPGLPVLLLPLGALALTVALVRIVLALR